MDVVFLVGRVLLVALPVMSGATIHFSKEAVEYARAAGAPAPGTLVPLSGVALIVGGISVGLGILGDAGALILIATLLPITYFMHAYWKETDAQQQQVQFAMFWKNVAIIGGAVLAFWAFNQLGDAAPVTITDSLFDRF